MVKVLSYESVQGALDSDSRCSCSNETNQTRCEHKFSLEQVWKLRGDWHSSVNPEYDMALRLKQYNCEERTERAPRRSTTVSDVSSITCVGFKSVVDSFSNVSVLIIDLPTTSLNSFKVEKSPNHREKNHQSMMSKLLNLIFVLHFSRVSLGINVRPRDRIIDISR